MKYKHTVDVLVGLPLGIILGTVWLMGFVIASGFWSTCFCIFPPYAWYLVIERFMKVYHILELPVT